MNNTIEKWLFGCPKVKWLYSIQVRWASVQAIDVKFSQDFIHQKSLKSVKFWQSHLKKWKGWRFLRHSVYQHWQWFHRPLSLHERPCVEATEVTSSSRDVGWHVTALFRQFCEARSLTWDLTYSGTASSVTGPPCTPCSQHQPATTAFTTLIFIDLCIQGRLTPHYGWEINPHIWHGEAHFSLFGPNMKAQSYSLALCSLDTLMRLSESPQYTELGLCAVK